MLRAPRPLGIGLAAIGLLLFVMLGVMIEAGITRPFDGAIIGALRDTRLVAPLAVLRTLTQLGSTEVIAGVAILLLLAELVLGRPRLGIAAAVTIGLAALVNSGLKDLVDRARPDLLPPLVSASGYSFPSGHSTSSMVAYGIAVVLLTRNTDLPAWVRWGAAFALGMLVAAVGISRVYLGVHFPSDVLGGWLLGAVVVVLFATITGGAVSPGSTLPGGGVADADPAGPRSGRPGAG